MLDAFIIEEIKRRERERERADRQRPVLEVPRRDKDDDDEGRRGDTPEPVRRGPVHIDI